MSHPEDTKEGEQYAQIERALELGVSIRTHLEHIAQPAADLMATLGIAGGDELTVFVRGHGQPEGGYRVYGRLMHCAGGWVVVELDAVAHDALEEGDRVRAFNLEHVAFVRKGLP